MFYVYILQSLKTKKFYIGSTEDLEKRLKFHNECQSKFTSKFLPYILVYQEVLQSKAEALKREKEIKKMKNTKRFLDSMVITYKN